MSRQCAVLSPLQVFLHYKDSQPLKITLPASYKKQPVVQLLQMFVDHFSKKIGEEPVELSEIVSLTDCSWLLTAAYRCLPSGVVLHSTTTSLSRRRLSTNRWVQVLRCRRCR